MGTAQSHSDRRDRTLPSSAGRRRISVCVVLAGGILSMGILSMGTLAGSPAAAQSGNADSYLDPLAYTRLDSKGDRVTIALVDHINGQERSLDGRRLLRGSREVYLPSSSVAAIFQAVRFWQGQTSRLDLKIGQLQFGATAGSRVMVTPGGDALLPVPVLAFEGDLWLPLVSLHQVIGPQTRKAVVWDPGAARLELGNAGYNVLGIRTEVVGRTTTVRFLCSAALAFSTASPRPDLVELTVFDGVLDPAAVAAAEMVGLLRKVTFRQGAEQVLIELEVGDLVGRVRSYSSEAGGEIVVVLEEEQVSALPDPVPRGHTRMNIEVPPSQITSPIRVKTVVIDPGHGGADHGAVGSAGTVEKDVNLAVALELRQYLRRHGDLEVVLTRDRDKTMEPAARAELANTSGGDLFVSLHCNSWFNGEAQGLETYFLSPSRSDGARNVESAEDRPGIGSAGVVPDNVEFIVWEMVQNRFILSSGRLAEAVQRRVARDLGVPDRGVRQAGFRVLVGAYMPAVLVEMGFLSNPQEEERLKDRAYQRRLAHALGDAILEFRDQGAPWQKDSGAEPDPESSEHRE